MPRGEKSGDPDVIAKRTATYAARRRRQAARLAERLLHRWVPDAGDAAACLAWLQAHRIRLDDPAMRPASRLRWLRRARREMGC